CFFFSSRRRHTRLVSDWSSDVCSSDLRKRRATEARATLDRSAQRRGARDRRSAVTPLPLVHARARGAHGARLRLRVDAPRKEHRSEEHTSELQSLTNLVCRLLLEKKKR